jgi:hypothetical protein
MQQFKTNMYGIYGFQGGENASRFWQVIISVSGEPAVSILHGKILQNVNQLAAYMV